MGKILVKEVGIFKNDKVFEYTIKNEEIEVKILNLGCIIKELSVKDREGKLENIVLTYENIEDYYTNPSYYGALIGRTAGRIGRLGVSINNKEMLLNKNYPKCNCHGGEVGFNKKIWNVIDIINKEDEKSITFEYISENLEEGYFGELKVKVKYILTRDSLKIEYFGKTDEDTLVNLTNHSYFNLSGDYKENILNHTLEINSKKFLEIDDDGILTGKILDTINTPFDFTKEKKIGEEIESNHYQIKLGSGYDHPFMLDGKIIYRDYKSGRQMEVTTDNISAVIYTMNFKDSLKVKGNKDIDTRYGICFECQSPPIGKNEEFKEYSILKKEDEYKKSTVFKFSTL